MTIASKSERVACVAFYALVCRISCIIYAKCSVCWRRRSICAGGGLPAFTTCRRSTVFSRARCAAIFANAFASTEVTGAFVRAILAAALQTAGLAAAHLAAVFTRANICELCTIMRDRIMSSGKERKYLEYRTEYTRREYMVKYKQLQQTQRRCKDSTHASRDLPAQFTSLHSWPQFSALHQPASCAQK